MTTPAVSLNQQSITSPVPWDTLGSCPGVFQVSGVARNCVSKQLLETRPASVNNRRRRGTGWRDPSAWSHSKLLHNPVPINSITLHRNLCCPNCKKRYWPDGYGWYGFVTSSVQAFPAYLRQVATSRALLQLKLNRPNLAVAFAERKETEKTLVDSVKSIAHSVKSFRRANPKLWGQVVKNGAKNQFRGVPRKWLALQYGWKPLMSDVYASCNALSRTEQDRNPYRMKVTGSAHVRERVVSRRNGNIGAAYGFDVTDVNDHSCKVILRYHLKHDALAAFSSMGLTNPLELGWERVPYSFVLDWFLPVGNWLSTLDADLGWEFDSGTRTEFSRLTSDSTFWQADPATLLATYGYLDVSSSGESYKARGFNMNRSVYSSSPWAGLPSFKNPLSSGHIANAMSLLVEAFRR